MDILDASHLFLKHNISGAPVVDENGELVGILTVRDCFKCTLNACYYSEFGGKVSDFMTTNVETVNPDTSIPDIAELFLKARYRRFPVMEQGRLIGLISRKDVLRGLHLLR
jgi:CBS domain-containing protein